MGFMNMKKFSKRFGFTLSEVMITLSLIGVVATLTLSTVGTSVQQRARLAEFRTAYSKMEATLRSITHDEGIIYSCYLCPNATVRNDYGLSVPACSVKSHGCEDLTNKFVRAMGATRFCDNALNDGCLPANYPSAPAGSGCFSSITNKPAYVLDNSMIIILNSKSNGLQLFAVDVNGRSGPNRWGQDIFTFSVMAQDSNAQGTVSMLGIFPPTTCLPVSGSIGKSSDVLMKDSVNYR